ncbi:MULTISPECIES: hypothetical protein [unclassified Streptomyces]|uniref:hypothetical protein n=1 Tax=unclassified Streptomyces TaxID=2593676 RepID=UPI001905BE97|nr:hypothetical protein [Streptomyces sp. HSG2]
MISTRRITAAVGLAVGLTGLAAPLAGAAESGALEGGLSPTKTLDSLAAGAVPAEHRSEVLPPSAQLSRLDDVNQLRQVTGLVSPVFGAVPAIQT